MKKILIYVLLAVFVITMSSPVMADENPVYGSQSVTTGNVGIADTIEVKFTPKSRAVIIIDNDSIAADIFSTEFDFGYDDELGSIGVMVNANIAVDVSLESTGFAGDNTHVFNDWVTYQMNYTGEDGFDIQTYTPGAEVSVGWDDFVCPGSDTFDFEVHLTIPEGSTTEEWYDIAADTEVTDTVTITVSSAG